MDELSALLVIGGLLGLYYFNMRQSAASLNYFPGNVTNISLSGINPVATVELVVQNPSNVDFTIYSLAANATTDGTLIGNVSDFTPVTVAANTQQAIPLTIQLLSISIIDQIVNAFKGGNTQKTINVAGTVNANGYQEPLNLNFVVGL